MASQETNQEQPVEHIIIAYAATVQLRQSKFELDELLFYMTPLETLSPTTKENYIET
jgi:hypothetical protein